MNKPKTFAVKGAELLLRAFYEELLKVGYEGCEYNFKTSEKKDWISTAISKITTSCKLKEFKVLFVNDMLGLDDFKEHDATFQLPEQFNEALTFAKEQLNHPYWKMQEFEEGAHYLVRWKEFGDISTANFEDGCFFVTGSDIPFYSKDFSKIQKIEIPKDF